MGNSLWNNSKFTRLLASWRISGMGDWFDIFTLQLIFARELNASPVIMWLFAFLYFVPAVLFSPLAGVIADHYSKRNIIIIYERL